MNTLSRIALPSALLTLFTMGLLQPTQAQTYSAAGDFEAGYLAHQNPSGVWEYGWTQGLPSISNPLHLFTSYGTGPDSPTEQQWVDLNIPPSPAVYYATSAINNGNITAAANTLFATGNAYGGNAYANILFVAPASGTYSLSTTFQGVQNNDNADIRILANGVSVFSGTITSVGQTASYSGNISLAQGQTIDFAFGLNNVATQHPANVGLSAIISPAPEPSQTAALSLGTFALVGLVLKARRRSLTNP